MSAITPATAEIYPLYLGCRDLFDTCVKGAGEDALGVDGDGYNSLLRRFPNQWRARCDE